MESKSSNNADAETRQHNEKTLNNLTPGYLIKIHRDFHDDWAVYIGNQKGHEKVIYLDTVDGTKYGTKFRKRFLAKAIWAFIENVIFRKSADSGGEARVRNESFWTVVGNSKAENGNNKDLENGNIDNSNVVIRAKILKEKTAEHGQFYNSEHFANDCRYGQKKTPSEGISNATDKTTLNPDPTSANNKVDDKIREHNTKFLNTLEIGDLIKFRRLFYYHWAVYIGNDDDTPDATHKVIHWWGPPDFPTSKKGASIVTSSFWEAARNSKATKGNVTEHEDGTINGQQVAARAAAIQSLVEDELLTDKYNLFSNNCENFARWCRYGMRDDDKVKESPREHQRVLPKIEDHRTKADSEHSPINRERIRENLQDEKELRLLETKVKNLRGHVSAVNDNEEKISKRTYVRVILISAYITVLSLSGGRFGKIREALRLFTSNVFKPTRKP